MEFSNRSSLRSQGPQRERKALIAAARTLASAFEQRPFSLLRPGLRSLRSQERSAERLYEATTDQPATSGEREKREPAGLGHEA
jgi:hypothetical protein